jgi:hypothetical protein
MPADRVAPRSRAPTPDGSERPEPRDRSAPRAPVQSGDRAESGRDGRLATSTILSLCDRLLGEVGRRRHIFGWLRHGTDEWLPVDAYYPRNRLVVMCGSASRRYDALYRDRVTEKGLRFLTIDPTELGTDRTKAEFALKNKIFGLQREVPGARPDDPASATAAGRAATAAPDGIERPPVRRRAPARARSRRRARIRIPPGLQRALGVPIGLVLAAGLIAELYLAVDRVAFRDGRLLLAFALALDACSRALGTTAAERAGERLWAVACAIGGAPFVAVFSVRHLAGRARLEPAPLAFVLSMMACLAAVLALLSGN